MSADRWLPVVGFEGFYEVSDFGRVRSVDRNITYSDGRIRFYRGQMMTVQYNVDTGYAVCGLMRNSRLKMATVHSLVLEAFVGPRPEGMEGCHNDGNPANPRLDNLRWDTPKNNQADRERHGTKYGQPTARGERQHLAKLNEETVREIRRLCANGMKQRDVAKMFGVGQTAVGQVHRRETWAHVADEVST